MTTDSVEPYNLETASNSSSFSNHPEKTDIPKAISLQPEVVAYAQLVINLAHKSVEVVMVGQATTCSGNKKSCGISLLENVPDKDEESVPELLGSILSSPFRAECDSTDTSSSQESSVWRSDESSKSNTDSSLSFECEWPEVQVEANIVDLQIPTLYCLESSSSFWSSQSGELDMYALLDESVLSSSSTSSSFAEGSSSGSRARNRLLCPLHFYKSASKDNPHSRYRLSILRGKVSRDEVSHSKDIIGYAVLEA